MSDKELEYSTRLEAQLAEVRAEVEEWKRRYREADHKEYWKLRADVARLTAALNARNTLTCVYCGTAYPPGSPTHGAAVLTEHIKVCEKHPLREAEAKLKELHESFLENGKELWHWQRRAREQDDAILTLEAKLKAVVDVGHDDDCILCGFKDRIALGLASPEAARAAAKKKP